MPNSLSAPRFLSAELFFRHNPLNHRGLRSDHRAKKRLRRGWSGCRARGQNATRGDEFSQRARHRLLPRKRLRGAPPARTSFEVVRHHVATRRRPLATRRADPVRGPWKPMRGTPNAQCSPANNHRSARPAPDHHRTPTAPPTPDRVGSPSSLLPTMTSTAVPCLHRFGASMPTQAGADQDHRPPGTRRRTARKLAHKRAPKRL